VPDEIRLVRKRIHRFRLREARLQHFNGVSYGAGRAGKSWPSRKAISDSTSRMVNSVGSNRVGAAKMPDAGIGAQFGGASGPDAPTFQPPIGPSWAMTKACIA
jgi:hypothetical protein